MRPSMILGAVFAVLSLFTLGPAASVHAAPPPDRVAECLQEERVWVSVVTEDGDYLANQCIDPPANGAEALTAAGLETTQGDGMICAIGGHPDPCPATFNGQYWHYYQGVEGEDWQFAQVGPDESTPEPGTIEAWCYNAEGEEQCTPPDQVDMATEALNQPQSPAATESEQTEPESDGTTTRNVIIVVVVLVAAGGAVALVLRRRSGSNDDGAVGGR